MGLAAIKTSLVAEYLHQRVDLEIDVRRGEGAARPLQGLVKFGERLFRNLHSDSLYTS